MEAGGVINDEIELEDRTTAIGLARYAREFFAASDGADEAIGHGKGYEIIAPAPVMFLVAHSMELALKAYLRHRGFTVKQITGIGHDLIKCWQAAVENGIEDHVELTEEDLGILGLINNLHASTQLRYIQTGFKEYPVFGPLEKVASKLLDAICPLVGYR